jgi:broad specificity phosphatase PhoE
VSGGPRDATLVLVRHGQTTWVAEGRFQGSADPPLSQLGEQQAAAVARRLARPQASPALPLPEGAPQRIWHSPLTRAASTAAAIRIAAPEVAPMRADGDLAELAQGDWEGHTAAEVAARWPMELAAWRTDPVRHHAPGGEALADAATRAGAAVERILGDLGSGLGAMPEGSVPRSPVLGYADPRVGGPGDVPDAEIEPWAIVVAHDGILRLVLMHLLGVSVEHYWALPFGLCSITVVELRAGRARLRAHNLADHLPA